MNLWTRKVICISALIALGLPESRAESPDWALVHDVTVRGLRRLYSLEIDQALQTFDSVSRIAPGDPRGPFFSSMVHFYLYSLNREEKDFSAFIETSENVIGVCEQLLDRNERDGPAKFFLGGIYGYRGLAYQTHGSLLNAARDGRKGYLLLEEAVAENPKLYDAQMGFGIFRYLVAKIPRSMRWILNILGFSGDLEGGLHSLRLAADKGTYTRTEAKLFLAQFLFSEGRQDTAVQYLNELRKEYPENTLFTVLYAFWQHRLDNIDEALKAALAAVELNKRKKIQYGEELAYSTLGSVYYTLNDFDKAKKYYGLYMKMTTNDERTMNYSILRAGIASEIAGDRATAVSFYRRMREPNSDRAWDVQHYRRGQELLKRPITEGEILIVRAGNESNQKNYNKAIALYREAAQAAASDQNVRARALYGMAQAQYDTKQFADVLETSNAILSLQPVNELWILPHALFKQGQAHAQLGNLADARQAFEKVRNYDDYEFQDRLESRAQDEINGLGK